MQRMIDLAERGWVPDSLIRLGIRRLLRERLRGERSRPHGARAVLDAMRQSPLAVSTADANRQHYEVPPEFFALVLGQRLKYSACLWEESVKSLDDAEDAMLRLTCERAGLVDGQSILELGCGWGSLSLWVAEHYPGATVLAVSNSALQRRYIEARRDERGLDNLQVITADMNDFSTTERFDRVVSVEMYEHMRNYEILTRRIAGWLRPDGRLFVHMFCHRDRPYLFEVGESHDWMAKHFFTGGLMPHRDIFLNFREHLGVERFWQVDGTHYEKTLRSWLDNLDGARQRVRAVFVETYGDDADRWVERWRLFFLACAELFAYERGSEWFVGHYLLASNGK